MKLAIATVCLSGGLRQKLEAIAAARFTAVEIFEADLVASPLSPSKVRALCADLGLTIVTYQPFRDFEGMPAARRDATFQRAERKFELMVELGCDLMLVCSAVAADAAGGIDRLADDLAELGDAASRHGLRIGYEALAWGRHVNDYRDAWEIVRRADRPNVGTILDTFHVLARQTDPRAIATIPADRIFLVQVADAPRLDMDLLSWSRHWRCMPFQGDLDLAPFMDALMATGYGGCLSLEIFNDRFRAGSPAAVAIDGHRSLIYLADEAARRHARRVTMAPRSAVRRVAFVEFAVDASERQPFAALLTQLGFAMAGRHRSKDVTLFRQGGIAFILNSNRQGFAHSYELSHGSSVCAMAFEVENAAAVVARATDLLYEPHVEAAAPGELDIPAFRGVGGSLVYFIDDESPLGRWSEIDFVPTGELGPGIGLQSVDHISQSMHYEEMLTWLLFYSSLLDCTPTPMQELIDPGGVVQSQVIESGVGEGSVGGLRLVLNGSQSHRTLASRFVTDFFGSGVQHIAFGTDDIFVTLDGMGQRGLTTLPVPANYYDDLRARFGLSPAEIDRMQARNILYDVDASGEFRHAYTQALGGGFFFEFVERGSYKGYGAPNSAIRLAAQAQSAPPAGMPKA